MHLILVPNAELGQRSNDYVPIIPLGLLSLASVLSNSEIASVHVVDPRSIDFLPPGQTAEILLALEPDVVGFSTMCNSYPHTLRTAQLLKRAQPDLPVVFGGPHATIVAKETLNTFDFVDFVLAGECERSIIDFVSYLTKQDRVPADVPGLVFREDGVAVQSCSSYPLLSPEELPDIDYSIFSDLHSFRSIPLDIGRGCPFGCTFCTTNVYWERRYRLRSAQYVIDTVQHLKQAHGVSSFSFVHDNFTASPRRVARFCEQIIASGVSFEWRCSARPDSVDSELLDLMHMAGCRSIFMGIESGSFRIQQLCHKKVKLDQVMPTVWKAMTLDMALTTSFIVGFPYEELEDIEKTLRMMAEINYEGRTRCDLQLHLLSPVPGAPLTAEPNVKIALDETISDISSAGDLDNIMKGWIIQHGKPIFESFYHYLNPNITRQRILELRFGWFTLFTHLRLTALALEEARRGDNFALVSVFDGCEPPRGISDTAAVFEWCVCSVRHFLQKSSQSWAASVLAVLEFEAEVYHLRVAGCSNHLIECDYDVKEWVDRALTPASVVGLPRRAYTRYFIMRYGEVLKIAKLPV